MAQKKLSAFFLVYHYHRHHHHHRRQHHRHHRRQHHRQHHRHHRRQHHRQYYLYISILHGFNTMSITIVVFDLDASITVLYYYRENMITIAKKKLIGTIYLSCNNGDGLMPCS
jgi:hypothetical protein